MGLVKPRCKGPALKGACAIPFQLDLLPPPPAATPGPLTPTATPSIAPGRAAGDVAHVLQRQARGSQGWFSRRTDVPLSAVIPP